MTSAVKLGCGVSSASVVAVACAMAMTPGVAMADEVATPDVSDDTVIEMSIEEKQETPAVCEEEPLNEVVDVESETDIDEDVVVVEDEEAVISDDDEDEVIVEDNTDGGEGPDPDPEPSHEMVLNEMPTASTMSTRSGDSFLGVEKPADETPTTITHEVSTIDELLAAVEAASDGDTIKFTQDIVSNALVHIYKSMTVDFGGFAYTYNNPNGYGLLTNGDGVIVTFLNGAINGSSAYNVIVNGGSTAVFDGVDITNEIGRAAIQGQLGSHVEFDNGTITINGEKCIGISLNTDSTVVFGENGKIVGTSNDSHGIHVENNCQVDIYGTIDMQDIMSSGVSTNGSDKTANTVNIHDGAVITSAGTGVYLPGENDTTTIDKATITGYNSGVEVRGGTLIINDGAVITSTADEFKVTPNGSGTTVVGAAVAEVPHTHKGDVSLVINGGTFTGPVALYQGDPQQVADVADIELTINSGDFTGTLTNQPPIVVENLLDYVNGGSYNKVGPWAFDLASGKAVLVVDGKYTVESEADAAKSAGYIVMHGAPFYYADKAALTATAEDLGVTPNYNFCDVVFENADGEEVHKTSVVYGDKMGDLEAFDSLVSATIEKDGKTFKFTGWDYDGDAITGNTVMKPVYEEVVPVIPDNPDEGDNKDPEKPSNPEKPVEPENPNLPGGVTVDPGDLGEDPDADGEGEKPSDTKPVEESKTDVIDDDKTPTTVKVGDLIGDMDSANDRGKTEMLSQTGDATGVAGVAGVGILAGLTALFARRRGKHEA